MEKKNGNLLSRREFRESVFERDGHQCVICSEPAQDAHHILERRLFEDGGYYLDNGASLCGPCHVRAEETTLSADEIRQAAGINQVILPDHLYSDERYDKWGNPFLPTGQRLRGELFEDESVQKILSQGKVLGEFTSYVKYPRTYHLPWSESVTDDDRVLFDLETLQENEIVVTEKVDGENTTMYQDHIHARSILSDSHPSRSWVTNLWSKISYEIPDGWRICGENLHATKSIYYGNLDSFFLLFSIWDDTNMCLSWDETIEWAKLLDLQVVPILYRGPWDEGLLRDIHQPMRGGRESEGFVVRIEKRFSYRQFRHSVAKFVRRDHVRTHGHWMRRRLEYNELG